jgi:DNA-binding response OmpR family regulator
VLPGTDVLLNRTVVVEGGRSAELVAGLTEAGIPARAVSAGALQTLIAGLIVFEGDERLAAIREQLALLRRRQGSVAVVMLTDREDGAAAEDFECADAVLPADGPVATVVAQLRRLARLLAIDPPSPEPETLSVRNISIDLVNRHARAAGRLLELTPTEFLLLAHLARKRGVATHGELFREVHGYAIAEREAKSILKVHIWRLRAKLTEHLPDETPIVTVRGFGYLLDRRSGRSERRREGDRRG